MRGQRSRYNPVASQEEGANEESHSEVPAEETEESSRTETVIPSEEDVSVDTMPPPQDAFEVTILDFAQSKFSVPASPQWTIAQLMQAGAAVHKVSPSRQRLIFRGKLLADGEKTLQEYGIIETGMIVHLFPKPRVVITNQNSNEANEAGACEETREESGAHVPTIVMDAAEAERRAEILVLGSPDFLEAQNNVKLFSFMLLLISSIELLNLMGVAMGVPQTDQLPDGAEPGNYLDDYFPQEPVNVTGSNESMEQEAAADLYNTWGWPQTVDTFVSCLGIYVALIGLRASTENTLRLARRYMIGLVAAGVAWLLFNFFFMAAVETKVEEAREHEHADDEDFTPLSDSDIYSQTLQVMVLPGIVWFMCWMRAWHFHHLLHEAEYEATERMQSQARDNAEHDVNHDEELALSNSQAVLT